MMNRRVFASTSILAAALLSFGLHGGLRAQEKFPSKPIRIVYPAAPGAGVEAVVRKVATRMSDRLGQPILVEHKPGANTQIGINFVAKSPPDGYTIGVGFVTNLSLAQHVYKSLAYDPMRDLTPVGLMALNYLALVVRPDAPIASVSDMSKWAKSNPKGLSVGTTSVGGLPHLAFEQLARSSPMPFTIVSYNGNGQLLQDLMGGRLDAAMVDYTSSSQFIEAGKLKLVGITNDTRDPRHPKLPTIGESIPGYKALGWFGFVVAAGTPEPIVKTLNEAMNKAIAEPDVQETLLTFGLIPAPGSPSDFAARLRTEDRFYGELVQKINFQRQ